MRRVRIALLTSFFSILTFAALTTSGSAVEDERRQITLPPSIPKVEKPPAASLPPQIPKISQVPQVPKVWDTSITQTQRELEDILRIHQILQVQQQAQLREIQRITEQAEVHQKILNDLGRARPVTGTGETGASEMALEETLRVQKIALIQEQTRENQLRLKRLEREVAREKKSKKSPLEGLFKSFREQKLPYTSEKEKEKE